MTEDGNVLPAGSVPLSEALAEKPLIEQGTLEWKAPAPIVILLPDGRKVGMAVPKMSISRNISSVLAGVDLKSEPYEVERMRVKSLLYITDVDGEDVPKICDQITRAALEQKIGDVFLEDLSVKWATHFLVSGSAVLSAAKK